MSESDTLDRHILELPLEVKTGDAPGTFEGYGAIFGNVDRDGDVVAKGAFAESLKGGRVPALLWQHNAKEPIGRFDLVREDARGLYVKGRLAMTGRGLEAYALLKMGALDGLSIGFVTKEAARDSVRGVRTITRAELMEISLVTFPANDLARISTVKGQSMQDDITDVRSFEHFLRENGFSRTRAKAIATKGFRASEMESGDTSLEAVVADLRTKTRSLALMTKGVPQVQVFAKPGDWGEWATLTVVNPTEPQKFKISAFQVGPAPIASNFMVQVSYMSLYGPAQALWSSNGSDNVAYDIPAGMQEIRVRAKSALLPLYAMVSFLAVR